MRNNPSDKARKIGRGGFEDDFGASEGGIRASTASTGRKSARLSIHERVGSLASSHTTRHRSVRRVSVIIKDTEAEDETYDFTLGDPINDEETSFGRFRNRCGKIVNSVPAQAVATTLIIINAILLGVLTIESVKSNPRTLNALEWFDKSLLICFTIEFGMQLIYLGPIFLRRSWLVFDFCIIVFSWAFLGSSINAIRSMRIFRVFVLISKWSSLQNLTISLIRTIPQLFSILAVLLLFFYVYMVLITTLYADLWDLGYLPHPYFINLEQSFVTLFQMMTLDSWHDIVRGVMEYNYWSWLLFYSFVSMTTFIFLNLMIAVACESLIDLKSEEKKATTKKESGEDDDIIEQIVSDQADLIQAQKEMTRTLETILARL